MEKGAVEVKWWEVVARIGISVALGSLIGLQRELDGKPAGLRTHTMVALGATLLMLLSAHGFDDRFQLGDPSRIAAQVVSGIGFLGAGAILKEGVTVTGLTTAATLWVSGAIGLSVGVGFWLPAVLTAAVVVFVLVVYREIEERLIHRKMVIEIDHYNDGMLTALLPVFRRCGLKLKELEVHDGTGRFSFRRTSKKSNAVILEQCVAAVGPRYVRVNGKSLYDSGRMPTAGNSREMEDVVQIDHDPSTEVEEAGAGVQATQ